MSRCLDAWAAVWVAGLVDVMEERMGGAPAGWKAVDWAGGRVERWDERLVD